MSEKDSSPKWTRPDEVMKLHRLKLKKRQLQARMMNRTDCRQQSQMDLSELDGPVLSESNENPNKRKNPFRCKFPKLTKVNMDTLETGSCDNTLFQLLNMNQTSVDMSVQNKPISFTSILSQISQDANKVAPVKKGSAYIPIDWALKTKLRFTSPKPFTWNQKLRTCEEASGITGFVRCLSTDQDGAGTLDTSPNARFHQCCLVWQHPALPWLTLFPRSAGRVADSNIIAGDQRLKDALFQEFTESFRSLFQLVRARQCPYFYLCANAFTCVFRAAGISANSDIHALLSPTTRGFRQTLKDEDVVFTMPLKQKSGSSDSGVETQCSLQDASQPSVLDLEEEDEEEEEENWLRSMGMEAEEIKRLNKKQAKLVFDKERVVDRTPESLIYVEGVEAQALFNFLMNCKSLVTSTGTLAGVTPTLLSPIAFHGASLKSLKVRQSLVQVENTTFHSMELRGPILPHTVQNLCALLDKSLNEFSATFINMDSTRAFSLASRNLVAGRTSQDPDDLLSPTKVPVPSAFNKENLSDSGLPSKLLEHFCSDEAERVQALDSIKFNSDGTYTWS